MRGLVVTQAGKEKNTVSLNRWIGMGRLTADPELRQTQNGVSVCSFTLAVGRNYQKDKEAQTDFIDVVAWRQTAEFVSKYFSKGKMMIVEGRLQTRNYEDKNGNKRKAVEVAADNVMFGEGKSSGGKEETPPRAAQPSCDVSTGGFSEIDFDDMPF